MRYRDIKSISALSLCISYADSQWLEMVMFLNYASSFLKCNATHSCLKLVLCSLDIGEWFPQAVVYCISFLVHVVSTGWPGCLVLKQGAVNQLFLGVFLMFLACLNHARWAEFHLGILGSQE